MPNRIIKESVMTSESVNSLSDFEYRLWSYLILCADDVGRVDGRSAVIKGRCFPLRDEVTAKMIDNALRRMVKVGCLRHYEVDGKPYYYFPNWSEHQRIRNVKPKYPEPSEDDSIMSALYASDEQNSADDSSSPQSAANCRRFPQDSADDSELPQDSADDSELPQDSADDSELPQDSADCGKLPPNTIQYESNTNTNTNTTIISATPKIAVTPPTKPIFIELILNDGSTYGVPVEDVEDYKGLYPAVDVEQEFRKMAGWCKANEKNRKTRSGIKKFINSWLTKEQDKYHPAGGFGKKINSVEDVNKISRPDTGVNKKLTELFCGGGA